MAHDAFISYSHHDKAVADAICATLEARKIRCWYAPRNIVAGTRWGQAIIEAIGESSVLVLVLSANANLSEQVLNEVERAVSKGVAILLFRIDDVEPSPALELFVMGRHWLDATTTPLEPHLELLGESVASLLGKSTDALTPAQISVESTRSTGESLRRRSQNDRQ